MPLVTPAPGDSTFLWKLNLKINGPVKGFNFKLWLNALTPALAVVAGNDIAGRVKYLLPQDSEIFTATISKDDHKRDSLMLETAAGPGLYNVASSGGSLSSCDTDEAALLIRFEHRDGSSDTKKFCPIPDNCITKRALVSAFALNSSYAIPIANPAVPSDITAWVTNFGGLIQSILFNSVHVSSGHTPGGPYNYALWTKAIPLRVGRKKGGRAFA
jgi:hypothetical protein